jgi:hypothetical protein
MTGGFAVVVAPGSGALVVVLGAIIVVDDYANEALPGVARAVDEWLRIHGGKLRVEASLAIIAM